MAKVTIGGTEYEVPELNFIALERSWPFIEEAMTALDPMKGVSAALHIIAAGLVEVDNFDPATYGIKPEDIKPQLDRETQVFELTAKFLKRKTKATEIDGVREAIVQITKEAGLEPEEGEGDTAEAAEEAPSLSPETSTHTLPSSSQQDAKEAAGTA